MLDNQIAVSYNKVDNYVRAVKVLEYSLISDRLMDFMEQSINLTAQTKKELAAGLIEIIGNFFYEFCVPSSWHLRNIKRSTDNYEFYWISDTRQAVCPECKTISQNRINTYKTRQIQDLPLSGMTVYHEIKSNRYFCNNPECRSLTFIEQFEEIAEKDARFSERLKDFIVRYALESSSNSSSKTLINMGIKVSRDTILRLIKNKAAAVVAQNLKRDDVKVLSVDDINLRKGNSSTACSVFIDGETHRVLVIVQGATKEIAQKVIQQFPSANIVSRDRGTAYASAATQCDKIQVADGFHLVQNIHKVVKDALYQEVPHDLFVREGEGWIRMVNSASEDPVDTSVNNDGEGLVVMGPATLAEADLDRRIQLADLTDNQSDNYKKTMKILELTENGLRTSEISKRLSMTSQEVWYYRKNAPETIQKVEHKIDEYYQCHEQWQQRQKTIAKHARPSSESIVEPYSETVLRMFNEGKNHRSIHPVIQKEGYEGSANAIYQYLIKYAHENGIPYGRTHKVVPLEERTADDASQRPPRISIERTSRETIYERLLNVASTRREEIKQALLGTDPKDSPIKVVQSNSEDWNNPSSYADSIAEIVFDTKPKKSSKKN